MQEYCNGFMFNVPYHTVLLIQKNRPTFQAGKWNGIGGKVEPFETPKEAMVREFREETGVSTDYTTWEHVLDLQGRDFIVHFYRSVVDTFPPYQTTTDEVVRLWSINDIVHRESNRAIGQKERHSYVCPTLDNMRWILPIMLTGHGGGSPLVLPFTVLLDEKDREQS